MPRVKRPTPEDQHARSKDWRVFGQEFLGGSDRAAAVLGATWLDVRLEKLLESFLIDEPQVVVPLIRGALGRFGARCQMAMALGLISRESFEDLLLIKDIRNAFAHELPGLSFADSRIAGPCRQLHVPKERPAFARLPVSNPRMLFETSVVALANRISRSAEAAGRRRRRVQGRKKSAGRRKTR
jgi:hypothetical protein